MLNNPVGTSGGTSGMLNTCSINRLRSTKNAQAKNKMITTRADAMSKKRAPSFLALLVAAVAVAPHDADAVNYLGSGQPGAAGWSLQNWPSFSNYGGASGVSNFFQLAWYTQTGFTGTSRDRFEFWAGGFGGYQERAPGTDGSNWGISTPNVGAEYYYTVVNSNTKYATDGYRLWVITPTVTMAFPNGSGKTGGYGAGADQFAISFDINNSIVYNHWIMAIRPANFTYAFRNLNYSLTENGWTAKLRGGWSVTVGDIALGYQITDTVAVGVHHQYNISNFAESDFKRSKRGMLGPTFAYTGFLDRGLYIGGTLDIDYATANAKKGVNINGVLLKSF